MLLRMLLSAALFCSATSLAFSADALTLNQEKSKIEFVGSKDDGKHEGGFKKFEAAALADFESPAQSKLEITIDTTSLWSDNPKLTNHLKNPDFFDVRKHPQITFKSREIVVGETEKHVTLHGAMTMLGKSVDVEIPAVVKIDDASVTLNADFKIDRTKWGMNYGQGQVHNDVAIKTVLVFER